MAERQLWSPAEDRILTLHYPRLPLAAIGERVNRSASQVQVRAATLVREGRLDPATRFYQPPWTPEQDAWLRGNLGRHGWSFAACAKYLGRTVNSVRIRAKRLRIRRPLRRYGALTMNQACEALGVDHKAVRRLIWAKSLRAARAPEANPAHCRWVIYPADLIEFLVERRDLYDARRVTGEWKQYVAPGSPTSGYLSLPELAAHVGVVHGTVNRWLREGKFHALHLTAPGVNRTHWYVTRAEADRLKRTYTPPPVHVLRARVRAAFNGQVPAVVPEAEKWRLALLLHSTPASVAGALTAARRAA